MMLWVDKHVPRRIGEAHPMLCKRLYLRCEPVSVFLCRRHGGVGGGESQAGRLAAQVARDARARQRRQGQEGRAGRQGQPRRQGLTV
jgi:hypothetical protein